MYALVARFLRWMSLRRLCASKQGARKSPFDKLERPDVSQRKAPLVTISNLKVSQPGPTPGVSRGGTEFDVVILGAGLNSLNISIAFHAAYGMRSLTVMRTPVAMNERTVTSAHLAIGAGASEEDLKNALVEIAKGREVKRPTLLLANADSFISFIDTYRAELEEHYLLAQVDSEKLAKLADKAHFQEACTEIGIPTIPTEVVDFSRYGSADFNAPAKLPWAFPVIGKPAKTADYARIKFPGKRKVFVLNSHEEYEELVGALGDAGFKGRFLFQELIKGDDTSEYSITGYRSRTGGVTLTCAAQVLLGEHTPDALGRPAAMLTGPHTHIVKQFEKLLDHVGYVGFANVDLKVDPKSGTAYFLEVNPRLGRNNHYVTSAGGAYPEHIVADLIDGAPLTRVRAENHHLYSILPTWLVKRYVTEPQLRAQLTAAVRAHGVDNPYLYAPEGAWMRGFALASGFRQVQKFRKYYPKATKTGF